MEQGSLFRRYAPSMSMVIFGMGLLILSILFLTKKIRVGTDRANVFAGVTVMGIGGMLLGVGGMFLFHALTRYRYMR